MSMVVWNLFGACLNLAQRLEIGDPRWIRTLLNVTPQKTTLSLSKDYAFLGNGRACQAFRQITLKTFKDNKRHMVVRKKFGILSLFLGSKTARDPSHNQGFRRLYIA